MKDTAKQLSFHDSLTEIYEQIFDPITSSTAFLHYDKTTDKVQMIDSFELDDGTKIVPKQSDLFNSRSVLLPSNATTYESDIALIAEIQAFIHRYVDVHSFYEKIASYYVLLTWVYENHSVVPYLRALGDYGTGKTRFIQTIGALSYKSMVFAGATSDAYIFRVIEIFRGTLVINEFERVNTDKNSNIIVILNNGYEKNMPVGRIVGDKTLEPRVFDVFCPKIFSTRERFTDQALESRIISVPMKATTRNDIPSLIDDTFWEESEQLRNKLLMYRFRHYGNSYLREEQNAEKIKKISHLEPRLRQTLLPLFYIIEDPKLEADFLSFTAKFQTHVIDARIESVAGSVYQKLNALMQSNPTNISIKELTVAVNADIEQQRYQLSSKRIGKVVREELGLKTHRGAAGVYFIDAEPSQLSYLKTRYETRSPLSSPNPLVVTDIKVDVVDNVDLPNSGTSLYIDYPVPPFQDD